MNNVVELTPNLINFVVGIDPGKKGAIIGLDKATGQVAFMEPLPLVSTEFNPVEFLLILKKRPVIHHIFLEMAQSYRGQGIVSTFNYARDYGIIIGILVAAKYPFTLVRPQTWQKEMFNGTLSTLDPKVRAYQAASRLWPGVSFLKSPKCKVAHTGLVDAILIAEYGRRVLK